MKTKHFDFPECEFPKLGDFNLDKTYFVLGLRNYMRIVTIEYKPMYRKSEEARKFLKEFQKKLNMEWAIQKAKELDIFEDIVNEGKKAIQFLGTLKEQIIDPKYWDDIANFFGMGSKLIFHPHLWLAFLEQLKSFEPTSDCLVVCQCGGTKPYSNAKNKRWLVDASIKSKKFDLCVWSVMPIMITPIDFSVSYPFYFYDAGHYSSDATSNLEIETSVTYGLTLLILAKKYKKIVFINNTTWDDGNRLRYIEPFLKQSGIEYHNVITEADLQEFTKAMKNRGLAKTRILCSRLAKDKFFKIMNIDEEELKSIPKDDLWYAKEKSRLDLNNKFGILYNVNEE